MDNKTADNKKMDLQKRIDLMNEINNNKFYDYEKNKLIKEILKYSFQNEDYLKTLSKQRLEIIFIQAQHPIYY